MSLHSQIIDQSMPNDKQFHFSFFFYISKHWKIRIFSSLQVGVCGTLIEQAFTFTTIKRCYGNILRSSFSMLLLQSIFIFIVLNTRSLWRMGRWGRQRMAIHFVQYTHTQRKKKGKFIFDILFARHNSCCHYLQTIVITHPISLERNRHKKTTNVCWVRFCYRFNFICSTIK